MQRVFRHITVFLFATLLAAAPAVAAGNAPVPEWETLRENAAGIREDNEIGARDNIDIVNRDGILYITVEQPVKVEIYSILGQLITSRQLKPGTVRLTIRQRGVYILKAGSITRRINL